MKFIKMIPLLFLAACAHEVAPIYDMDVGDPPTNPTQAIAEDSLVPVWDVEIVKGPHLKSCQVNSPSGLKTYGTFHGWLVEAKVLGERTYYWFHGDVIKGTAEIMPAFCPEAMAWR